MVIVYMLINHDNKKDLKISEWSAALFHFHISITMTITRLLLKETHDSDIYNTLFDCSPHTSSMLYINMYQRKRQTQQPGTGND